MKEQRIITLFTFLLFLAFLNSCTDSNLSAKNNQGKRIDAKHSYSFISAQPVWPKGREREMNLTAGFIANFEGNGENPVYLRVTGSSIYRIYLNGEFIGHGPARGPRDYYRVDIWELPGSALKDQNSLSVEVAGYNINSYYVLDQPSFLQAEIVSGDKVLAATGKVKNAFKAILPDDRVRKVERYNFQRTFMESYKLTPGYDHWKTGNEYDYEEVECAVQSAKNLISRRVAIPRFRVRQPVRILSAGEMAKISPPEDPWRVLRNRSIGPTLKGFYDEEITTFPAVELQSYINSSNRKVDELYSPGSPRILSGSDFAIYDMGVNLTGFIGAKVNCREPSRLIITFDEILTDGDVDYKRYYCNNLIELDLEPGSYSFESIEPYTLQYMKFIVMEGECAITEASLREYTTPDVWEAGFSASDPRLNDLFDAARETYRQNSVDIFMDCPSRERAGWLCDSYFTARVAQDLSGHSDIETNFLENFLLPDSFRYMPEGMLPPCYPADQTEHRFIPNWAMFFVIQLEEYYERSGDRTFINDFEPRVMNLLKYFEDFENEDGLLEKLESWVFVEWSEANDFVQDVNYPSNALYAGTLEAAGHLYKNPSLIEKAGRIREEIRKQSFDGNFFVDNAIREEGNLIVTNNHTEACQYYMFYFDVATPESHEELWQKLQNDFGPERDASSEYPEVSPANAFIGNYLRIDLLSRTGDCRQIKDEIIGYFHPMSERTGTLWEHMGARASCNHGFASHVAHSLYRDVLGINRIDHVNKKVHLRIDDVGLGWCEGRMPTPDGPVILKWQHEGNSIYYDASVPAGYSLDVENISGLELRKLR